MIDLRRLEKNATQKAQWKTKRRIMRSFKMNEISGVDNPAQEGARIVMFKRADPAPHDAQTFAKASFQEALDQRLMDQAISEAFCEAFDQRWTIDSAFQEALKDIYQDPAQTVAQYTEVVRQMAMTAADQVAAARQAGGSAVDLTSEVSKAVGALAVPFRKTKETPMFKTLAELMAAIAKYAQGDRTISKADLQKAAIELGAVAEINKNADLALDGGASLRVAELERQIAEAAMPAAVRSHYDGLDATAKAAFLAKSATEQAAEVEQLTKGDPVVYTTKDGVAIRKSDGAVALLMAKNFDQLNSRMDTLEGSLTKSSIEKRAQTEFPNLPLGPTVQTLKAAAALDEKDAADLIAGLTLANKAAAGKFRTAGQRMGKAAGVEDFGGAGDDAQAAEDKLDEMAKGMMAKASTPMTYEQAYDAVVRTPEGRELYAQAVGFEAN